MTDPNLNPEVYGPDHADGRARAKAAMDAADKARREAENDVLSRASDLLGDVSDYLHLASFSRRVEDQRAFYLGHALESLRTACAVLGYYLVKRDG